MVWLIKLEKINNNNNDMFIKFLVIQIVLTCYVDLLRPSIVFVNTSILFN
jgi:hypothetical protein